MRPVVIRGRAERLPLPDASVDLIVTSPPYFALRSYTDTVFCLMCIDLKRDGRDPRQAYPDYAEHVERFHKAAHYAGQIGSEPTPAAYIAALVECTREWVRVLKPSGSIFVNLGDKYSGYFNRPDKDHQEVPEGSISRNQWLASQRLDPAARYVKSAPDAFGIPYKSLMLLPERYRIACVDQLGLIARAVLVWSKPNGLPESVTDRVRRSHEDWVHLVKQPRYFAAVDEIREQHSYPLDAARTRVGRAYLERQNNGGGNAGNGSGNPLGKLPGSVWEVAAEPLKVPEHLGIDHFAAFPTTWPKRLILGWSPSGVCTACGEGRRPVVEKTLGQPTWQRVNNNNGPRTAARLAEGQRDKGLRAFEPETRGSFYGGITGYACACTPYTDHPGTGESSGEGYSRPGEGVNGGGYPTTGYSTELRARPKVGPWREYHFDRWTPAPTRPSVCLDPFGGTGTTAHVAAALGRVGITVDLSSDYSRLAAAPELFHQRRRKVLGLEPPPKPVAGPDQFDLFAEEVS